MSDPIAKIRLLQLIDAYGAAPRLWPAEERARAREAVALFGADAEIAQALAQAHRLDTALAADRSADAASTLSAAREQALGAAILARAPGRTAGQRRGGLMGWRIGFAPGWAASAIAASALLGLGFWAGLSGAQWDRRAEKPSLSAGSEFLALTDEWERASDWAGAKSDGDSI